MLLDSSHLSMRTSGLFLANLIDVRAVVSPVHKADGRMFILLVSQPPRHTR